MQQFNKLVQASQENRQAQGYKFSVPSTPNIKFSSAQQVQHTQMMQTSYPPLSQYNTSHSVSLVYFLISFKEHFHLRNTRFGRLIITKAKEYLTVKSLLLFKFLKQHEYCVMKMLPVFFLRNPLYFHFSIS